MLRFFLPQHGLDSRPRRKGLSSLNFVLKSSSLSPLYHPNTGINAVALLCSVFIPQSSFFELSFTLPHPPSLSLSLYLASVFTLYASTFMLRFFLPQHGLDSRPRRKGLSSLNFVLKSSSLSPLYHPNTGINAVALLCSVFIPQSSFLELPFTLRLRPLFHYPPLPLSLRFLFFFNP